MSLFSFFLTVYLTATSSKSVHFWFGHTHILLVIYLPYYYYYYYSFLLYHLFSQHTCLFIYSYICSASYYLLNYYHLLYYYCCYYYCF